MDGDNNVGPLLTTAQYSRPRQTIGSLWLVLMSRSSSISLDFSYVQFISHKMQTDKHDKLYRWRKFLALGDVLATFRLPSWVFFLLLFYQCSSLKRTV